MNRPLLRVWQPLEVKKAPNPYYVALPANGNWQTILTSTAFTINETRDIRATVSFSNVSVATGAATFDWGDRLTLNNVAPTEMPFLPDTLTASAAATYRRLCSMHYTWEAQAPGTYTIRFEASESTQTARTRQVYYPVMSIDIARA